MAGRQSEATAKALRWLGAFSPEGAFRVRTVQQAAKKFGVHESTLWRALGKQKSNGK